MKILKTSLYAFLVMIVQFANAIEPNLIPGFKTEQLVTEVNIPEAIKSRVFNLDSLLFIPEQNPPWKVVVLASNCSGLEDRMWRLWVPELLKNDIAVVLLDSFSPRGIKSLCFNQYQMTFGERLQDAHQLLDSIRKDKRFVSDKVALGGHSTGAITALQSSYLEVQSHLQRKNESAYNAFISASASCELTFKKPQLSGPLLLISGEKDDWTRKEPCIKEVERLKKSNQPAQIEIVPNAFHTFSTSGVHNPRLMKAPSEMPHTYFNALSYRPLETVIETEDGEVIKLDQVIRKYAGFMGNKIFGATSGGEWDKAQEAVNLSISFLKKNGW